MRFGLSMMSSCSAVHAFFPCILHLDFCLNLLAAVTPVPTGKDAVLKNAENGGLPTAYSNDSRIQTVNSTSSMKDFTVSITVIGASGDLAKKKIFPALFALFYEDCLPKVILMF